MKKLTLLLIMTLFSLLSACEKPLTDSTPSLSEPIIIRTYLNGEVFQESSFLTSSAILMNQPQVPNGYEWNGWLYEGTAFDENTVQPGQTYELDASFKAIQYALDYNLFGGTHSNPNTITIEDTLDLEPATQDGFVFLGWFLDDEYSGIPLESLENVQQNLTLYAKFEPQPLEVLLNDEKSLHQLAVNIDLTETPGAFVDLSHTTPKDRYYDSYYEVYYADGTAIEFHFIGGFFEKNIEHAFYYGRLLGWLPETLRDVFTKVEFSEHSPFQYRYLTGDKLVMDIKYERDYHRDKESLGTLVEVLLEPYYKYLSDAEIENYRAIIQESDFVLSEKAQNSPWDDFLESYIFYLMQFHLAGALPTELNEHTEAMQSRIDFFSLHGLKLDSYTSETRQSIQAKRVPDTPIMWGTVWDLPMLFEPNDPTDFERLTYQNTGYRMSYDHRDTPNGWQSREYYLFEASYRTGPTVEFQLNSEFDLSMAQEVAQLFAERFGQLPALLRSGVLTYTLHEAPFNAGGGSQNIVVAVDPNDPIYENPAFMEMVAHEAAHASLDWDHGGIIDRATWLEKAALDGAFISNYAADFPEREDVAESIIVYLIYKYRPDRIHPDFISMIERTMTHRIEYFDTFDFSLPE